MILAVLSIVGGWLAAPAFWGGAGLFRQVPRAGFWRGARRRGCREAPRTRSKSPSRSWPSSLLSWASRVAYLLYIRQPGKPEAMAKSIPGRLHHASNKYYVDEIYAAIIVKPLMWISRMCSGKWSMSS